MRKRIGPIDRCRISRGARSLPSIASGKNHTQNWRGCADFADNADTNDSAGSSGAISQGVNIVSAVAEIAL